MNRMRWKLMIGGLGLSLAGLAAVAGVPEKTGGLSCTPNSSVHQVARVNPEPPISIPVPKVAEMPALPAPALPPIAAEMPVLPGPTAPALPPIPSPAAPKLPESAPLSLPPAVSVPQPLALPTASTPVFPDVSLPPPASAVPPAFDFALPPPSVPVVPTATLPLPAPAPQRIPAIAAPDITPVALPPAAPVADLPPARTVTNSPPVGSSEPSRTIEKKLKVILHLGDDRPKFEVRDNEEVYLKVTSERVDVKSPGDAGTAMSQMRAAGKVVFVTPGGEGTCDELVVVPGTGQVIVTGKVSFTYNWGKLETTVSGEKMTFRLGAPAVAVAGPGTVTGVPAGYQRGK